jgi:hypothetical protein
MTQPPPTRFKVYWHGSHEETYTYADPIKANAEIEKLRKHPLVLGVEVLI